MERNKQQDHRTRHQVGRGRWTGLRFAQLDVDCLWRGGLQRALSIASHQQWSVRWLAKLRGLIARAGSSHRVEVIFGTNRVRWSNFRHHFPERGRSRSRRIYGARRMLKLRSESLAVPLIRSQRMRPLRECFESWSSHCCMRMCVRGCAFSEFASWLEVRQRLPFYSINHHFAYKSIKHINYNFF